MLRSDDARDDATMMTLEALALCEKVKYHRVGFVPKGSMTRGPEEEDLVVIIVLKKSELETARGVQKRHD